MRLPTPLLACLLCAAPPHAASAGSGPAFDLALGALIDDAGGSSFDFDAGFEPREWLRLTAGASRNDAEGYSGNVRGEGWRVAAEGRSDRFGLSAEYDAWSDSEDFDSSRVSGSASWYRGGLELSLLGEARRMEIDYSLLVLGRAVPRTAKFDATGIGGAAAWYGARWGGFVRFVRHDLDESFDGLLGAARSGALARLPRLWILAGSILTRTQGALEHEGSIGFERSFARASVSVELSRTRDAVFESDSTSLAASYRYALTPRTSLELTSGIDDAEGLDNVAFAGVSARLRL